MIMCMLFIFVDMGQPHARAERHAPPDAELSHVLGHDRAQRLPVPERPHRLGHRSRRSRTGVPPPELDQAVDLPVDPLGRQHPHGDGLPLRRPAGRAASGSRPSWPPRFLASAFAGGPALLILLCLIVREALQVRPGQGSRSSPWRRSSPTQ
ncbi:MAG: hypothetical protein MZU91_00505 [Desulfosudis oleivorans]|nr:hypothetical protein [Desulfosudis oleivorans]